MQHRNTGPPDFPSPAAPPNNSQSRLTKDLTGVRYFRPGGRERTYYYRLPTSTGQEHAQARGLDAPKGDLRSGAQGTATSAMRSETGNSERRERARARYICDAGTKTASVHANRTEGRATAFALMYVARGSKRY
eukprot:1373678-Pleurochrysis_carterae.AAC.1